MGHGGRRAVDGARGKDARRRRGHRAGARTSDPSGRRLALTIAPVGAAAALRVSVRPDPGRRRRDDRRLVRVAAPTRRSAASAAATTPSTSAARSSTTGSSRRTSARAPRTAPTAARSGDRYMFPNGAHAAYYVQSSFVSSALRLPARPRRARPLAPGLRPRRRLAGRGARRRRSTTSSLPGGAGRAIGGPDGDHRPPAACRRAGRSGPILDRLVSSRPTRPSRRARGRGRPARTSTATACRSTPTGSRAGSSCPRPELRDAHRRAARARHPADGLLPRCSSARTDRHRRPGAYDEAVAKGYVATHADGSRTCSPRTSTRAAR